MSFADQVNQFRTTPNQTYISHYGVKGVLKQAGNFLKDNNVRSELIEKNKHRQVLNSGLKAVYYAKHADYDAKKVMDMALSRKFRHYTKTKAPKMSDIVYIKLPVPQSLARAREAKLQRRLDAQRVQDQRAEEDRRQVRQIGQLLDQVEREQRQQPKKKKRRSEVERLRM